MMCDEVTIREALARVTFEINYPKDRDERPRFVVLCSEYCSIRPRIVDVSMDGYQGCIVDQALLAWGGDWDTWKADVMWGTLYGEERTLIIKAYA